MASDESPPASRPWVRIVAIALGVWLFISAFAWTHAPAAQANTWIVGVLIVIVGVWSLFEPGARVASALLALWLFFSTVTLTHDSPNTLWNNVSVAGLLFFVSLITTGPAVRLRTPDPA